MGCLFSGNIEIRGCFFRGCLFSGLYGKYLEIHGLIMEKEIKYYLPVVKAKIPLGKESVEEIEEFVHALLVL